MTPDSWLDSLAHWSPWMPLSDALSEAPRVPGVYLAREGKAGPVVYVGMAGERAGGKRPQGLRGRLAVYLTGKGLASGLGEAIFDRALADPAWVARAPRRSRGRPTDVGQSMGPCCPCQSRPAHSLGSHGGLATGPCA